MNKDHFEQPPSSCSSLIKNPTDPPWSTVTSPRYALLHYGAVSVTPRELAARIAQAGHLWAGVRKGTLHLEIFTFPGQQHETRDYSKPILSWS
jgi:hypothetical protein